MEGVGVEDANMNKIHLYGKIQLSVLCSGMNDIEFEIFFV